MSKKHYIVILLVALAGLVASFYLMPRSQEVALMQMKDKHFEEARVAYEQQLESGNLNIEVVTRLSELYLQIGAVDKAILVMEKFIAENPSNMAARERLGTYYQYAQRQDDYLRNLEEINALKPKPENLKVLSDIYNFNTEYNKQADTLKRLIATEENQGDTDAKSFMDLASIFAADKKYAEAATTLQGLKLNHPDHFTFAEEELLVTLLFDDKRPDEAAAEAAEWVSAHQEDYVNNARLINIVHFRGGAQLAHPIMANFSEEQVNSNPSLLEEYILLMLSDGKDDEAFQRLKTLYANDKLTPELKKRLMFAAIVRGENELAKNLLKETELKAMYEPELVSLVELGVLQDEAWLLKEIDTTFPAEEYADTYPILTAMLSVSHNRRDASKKLAELDKLDLTSSQLLQVSRVCARNKKYDCAEKFLAKLPPSNELNDQEVANVGSLYLDMHKWDKGYNFITTAAEGRNSLDIDQVFIKYAAVRGDADAVEKWLQANNDSVSQRMLADLYFAALNNKQWPTAVMVAEFYHAKKNTSLARSYLSQAYVQTGQYAAALKLLRENDPMSEDDENNYITALAKLSKNNPEYRNELREFASDKLKSKISKRQKMALVYALIAAKEVNVAMPAIRELALSEGGQWAALYADTLDKQGRHAEAREFWLTVADQPYTSFKQKREIAYNLLNNGYKNDAVGIFTNLAASQPADSQVVKELMFLWGPRPDESQMAWLENRYVRAQGVDKNNWATLIANTSTADDLLSFVERHPESAANEGIVRAYVQALIDSKQFEEQETALLEHAKETGNVAWLREYAKVMSDNGLKRGARRGYESIVMLDPTDDKALREAGVIAYSQADYSSSELYLDQYVNSKQSHGKDVQSYLGLFYYAELMRGKKLMDQAKPYYEATIQRIDAQRLRTAEALSVRAQSEIHLGNIDGGMATFDQAMTVYPSDDILRADKISALAELQRYDDARELLAQPRSNTFEGATAEIPLSTANGEVRDYRLLNNGSQILLRFAKPTSQKRYAETLKDVPWVYYLNEGYDSILVNARPGYRVEINKTGNQPSFKAVADNESGLYQAERQTALRYELLAARIDLETGHIYNASTRLNDIADDYPNDPQLIGFIANAENYGGNWPRAQAMLKTARVLSPENEDLAELDRSIRRLHAQNIKLDHEWAKRGSHREHITTLSGHIDALDNLKIGAILQNNNIETRNVRRGDGRIGDFDGNRNRGELYALYHDENGIRTRFSLFGNNDTAGVGGQFSFFNPLGDTTLSAEWHKPYWDFVEGVLDDATRDRLSLMHEIKPTTRLVINGGPNVNRYNIEDRNNVISTTGFEFNVVYRLLDEQPFLAIAYGIDAEYENDSKRGLDANGNLTRLFPLRTRELHFISLNTGYEFSRDTYGELLTGWGWDRFGGNGPAIEGRLTHEFNEQFDTQIRAFYGVDNSSTDDNVSRIGGYVRWRF